MGDIQKAVEKKAKKELDKTVDKAKEKIPSFNEKEIKDKVFAPINQFMEKINKTRKKVEEITAEVEKIKSLKEKIDFSPLQRIEDSVTRNQITSELESLINAASLPPKDEYLSQLNKYKADLEAELFTKIAGVIEQVYSYKKTVIDSAKQLTECQKVIVTIQDTVNKKIEEIESNLKQTKSIPGITPEIVGKLETEFNGLKSKVLEQTQILGDTKNILKDKNKLLQKLQREATAKLKGQVAGIIEKVEDIIKVKKISEPAAVEIKKSIDVKSDVLTYNVRMGIKFFTENKIEKAKEYLEKELSENPENWNAKNYMSKIYIKEKKYDQAVDEINQALHIFKKKYKIK